MMYARRLLPSLVLLLLAWPVGAVSPLLVTVGEVTEESAVVWGRGFEGGALTVDARPEGEDPGITLSTQVSREGDFTGKLLLTGLRPATRYAYVLRHGRVEAHPVRLLWSGDLGGQNFCRDIRDGYPIFKAMLSRRPDFFLFVGDTIYADHRCSGTDRVPGYDFVATTLGEFRGKHRYNRADPHVQAFFRATSVYAIWDDHEVRNDFAGPSEPLTPVGRRAFIEYWPIRPPAVEPGRLYRRFRWGKLLDLFILDTRQYRSNNRQTDGPGKTMLGPAQRQWLLDGVTASDAPWKVLVSSVPLSVGNNKAAKDSWSNANILGFPEQNGTGFATERDAILRAFRERGVRNLVWITADVHHAEVIRHQPWPGFSFHEFIGGPLSAARGRPRPLDMALNPRSLFGLGDTDNFGEVVVDPQGLTVRIFDPTGTMRFEHALVAE